MDTTLRMTGSLKIKLGRKAPFLWKLRHLVTYRYVWGWLSTRAAILFSRITGIPTMISELRAIVDGVDYGVLGRRVVTSAGVNFIVAAFQGTGAVSSFKYHGCGTGVVSESPSDTALGAECGAILNPDNTRSTGSSSGSSGNVYQSVATIVFDGAGAITEHGLFSSAAVNAATLLDRTVWTPAINVVGTSTIEFTYSYTIPYGG